MFLVWLGVVMMLAKWLEIGPVAQLDWWWVLLPFVLAFVWFEFLEKLLGLGSKQQGVVEEQERAAERRAQNLKGFRPNAQPPKKN